MHTCEFISFWFELEAENTLPVAAKVVDLDPCLGKKSVEDSACHPYNTRGSMSEVQSLSSFQSESCDDNGELQHSQTPCYLL